MEKEKQTTVEVDKEQLEKMIKAIEDLTVRIEELNKTIKHKDAIIEKLQRMLFGKKSEKARHAEMMANMPTLFDLEYPEESPSSARALQNIQYSRKKRCWNKDDLGDVERTKIVIEAAEEEKKCPWCGKEMEKIGEEKVRTRVIIEEPKIRIEEIYTETYVCPSCRQDGEDVLFKTEAPLPVIPHSFASAEAIAHVASERFVKSVPYNRQEKEWKWLGLSISRRTMSNWIMAVSELYLEPVVLKMREHLLKEELCHCDETPIQVLREEGRKNTSKSWMWVYSSAAVSRKPIRIFQYAPGRGSRYPKAFLEGFEGFLVTDGYGGYSQIENTKRALCWAHVRRKFFEALPSSGKNIQETEAYRALERIGQIFHVETELQKLEPARRAKERDRMERPLAESLFAWAEEIIERGTISSINVKGAFKYMLARKEELSSYLDNGSLPMTNSLAERTIRNFAVGRNNWLFSGSPRGAKACGVLYSIVESAKANGLIPYKYILHLLKELSRHAGKLTSEILEECMPWNPNLISICQ